MERHAVASFVAGLHGQPAVADFYAETLRRLGPPDIVDAIRVETARGVAQGPYGRYPHGPLSSEDEEGPDYRVSAGTATAFGRRLAAALEHAHLLVFHPRDASPAALHKLLDAGWSTTDVVTLSQLVSFLAFQIRVVVGLRALRPPKAMGPSIPRTRPYSWAFWPRAISEKETSKMAETTLSRTTGSPSPSPRRSLAGCRGSNRCPQTS